MKTRRTQSRFGKWLILSVAALFSVYAIFLLALQLFGEPTLAKLTSYRQEYGERNETIRNNYTYQLAYEFMVDGKKYTGTGQRIASSVFLKPSENATIKVRYLPCCPKFNYYTEGKKDRTSIAIYFAVAGVLFWFFRRM